jgi:hypothetical protein
VFSFCVVNNTSSLVKQVFLTIGTTAKSPIHEGQIKPLSLEHPASSTQPIPKVARAKRNVEVLWAVKSTARIQKMRFAASSLTSTIGMEPFRAQAQFDLSSELQAGCKHEIELTDFCSNSVKSASGSSLFFPPSTFRALPASEAALYFMFSLARVLLSRVANHTLR